MIINRSHVPWALLVVICTAFCVVLYLANFHPDRLPYPIELPASFGEVPPKHNTIGGTPLGIAFGVAALLIFIFAALLNVRKKKRLWKIGHVQVWLRAHIWLTILTIPLVLLHSGFRLGGPMTTLLVVLYTVVMVSGFYGLALQQFMPRMMQSRLPHEVIYEEIPYLKALLVRDAEKLRDFLEPKLTVAQPVPHGSAVVLETTVSTAAPDPSESKLLEFLDSEVLPYLRASHGKKYRLGSQQTSDDLFRLLKLNVSERHQPNVDAIQTWCDDRRQTDLQVRLHQWMHAWLLVHAPVSFLLLVLAVWHAVATLYFF